MGQAKERMMEIQERGYGEDSRLVCQSCVGNEPLKEYIQVNGEKSKCAFCGKTAICVTLEALAGEIVDGIRAEYTEAVNEMGRDEGEYVGAGTWDTYDLLDELNDDMELEDNVLQAIIDIVEMTTWCENDPYALRENEEQLSLWEQFCKMVQRETRYVFFRLPKKDKDEEISPNAILQYISEKAESLMLIKSLEKDARFFRGRPHSRLKFYTKPEDLASPPTNKAKANRMSAEGISIFYGAGSIRTVINEIYSSSSSCVSVAAFKNLRPLILLDLTEAKDYEYPSIFDRDNRENRQSILFFKKLSEYLSRPIEEMERVEYVPAQIVAEYFRYIYNYQGQPIDGIIYPSSKDTDGVCYALFFDQKQCLKTTEATDKQVLSMVKGSAKVYNVFADIKYAEKKSIKKGAV